MRPLPISQARNPVNFLPFLHFDVAAIRRGPRRWALESFGAGGQVGAGQSRACLSQTGLFRFVELKHRCNVFPIPRKWQTYRTQNPTAQRRTRKWSRTPRPWSMPAASRSSAK